MRAVPFIAMLSCLAGCSTLLPPSLPELRPEFRREQVSTGRSSCSPNQCVHTVKVGDQQYRVETRTRIVPAKELTGANAVERAAGGLIGWGLRRAGASTIDEQVVVGTRTVSREGSIWHLQCAVAWIDQRERSKDETEHMRISEGMDCVESYPDSISVRAGGKWRFRYGDPPTLDSMAAIADTVGFGHADRMIAPLLRLESEVVVRYHLTEEPFGKLLGTPRSGGWRVQRSDSSVIGALRVPPVFSCMGPCALDLGAPTAREEDALRFIAAALVVPLQR